MENNTKSSILFHIYRSVPSFLIMLILLSLFRKPFSASISQQWLSPILAVSPLLLISILLIRELFRGEVFLTRYKYISLSAIVFFIVYLSMTLIQKGKLDAYLLSEITLSLIFPLGCYVLFSRIYLKNIFDLTLTMAIVISFVITISEFVLIKLDFASAQDIHVWLTGIKATYDIRINTFMGLGAISGLLSLCGYAYFLSKIIFNSTCNKKILSSSLLILSLFTVFLDDSFLLIVGAVAVTVLIWIFSRDNHVKWTLKSKMVVVTVWMSIFVVALRVTPIADRFEAYFYPNRDEISTAIKVWPPHLSGCNVSELLTGIPYEPSMSKDCNPGEFHGFLMVFKTGLLSTIPWFMFLFSPVALFAFRKEIGKNELPLMLGVFAFLFPLLHYSGVEMWGNNYLYGMLVALLFKSAFDRTPSAAV